MAYFTDYVTSSNPEISYDLDFDKNADLKGYEDFEVLILAEEINNGKMMLLSEIYSPTKASTEEQKKTKTADYCYFRGCFYCRRNHILSLFEKT